MIKKIITSILVLLSIITIIPVACDTTEGEDKYEITARLLLPEELKDAEGEISIIYEGKATDIFLELNQSNDYVATQYVVNGTYDLYANIPSGGFADYSFLTKKTIDVASEKVVIDVFMMRNSEYVNADMYEETPIGLSECGEVFAKRQEQRLEEEKVANAKPVVEEEKEEKKLVMQEEKSVMQQTPEMSEEDESEIKTINANTIVAACIVIIIIMLLLLYLLIIRPKKLNNK